ncbi:MAG: hypothetical protein M0Q93_02320 [Terrimicrobiaceae bacterium]|nr:hypothetical protein [Terrimicrobiaceae bacterium]
MEGEKHVFETIQFKMNRWKKRGNHGVMPGAWTRQPLFPAAGAHGIDAVDGSFGGDFLFPAGKGKSGVGNREGEVLGHFALADDAACAQPDPSPEQ